MTDTETLLRKAAMAAGYSPFGWIGGRLIVDFGDGSRGEWDPIKDSAQALDLASDLRICMEFTHCADDAPVVYVGLAHQRRDWPSYEHFPDPRAATRLAITRAAAAIYDSQQGAAA